MTRPLAVVAIVLFATAALPAAAAEQTLSLDPEACSVTFTLGAALHTVHGTMSLRVGEISFDLESGGASGEVVFDARHTETGNKRRDINMHRDVLESEAYPAIVFRPTSVEGELVDGGVSDLTLSGMVSIHGSEHPLKIVAAADRSAGQVSATASFAVPYVEWGMEDPSGLLLKVKKHVDVSLDVHGTLTQ